jgi:zinc transport system ATP-binding protein
MDPFALEVEDLWFSYGSHVILKDVNLKLKQGEFVAVLGPNGSGKTTLIKLVLGILKPDRGSIRMLGKRPSEVVDQIGYVPQETTLNKSFPISVRDVALMGRLGHTGRVSRYSRHDREVADDVLKRVGMWDYRDRPIGKLSGGQRQRVLIARAIASDPKILFLDEPTSSIDKEFQTDLYEFLKDLNRTVTIVVISHDLSIVSSYAKSVACVNQTVFFHDGAEITQELMDSAYHCPVDLIAHGMPHRVLHSHNRGSEDV